MKLVVCSKEYEIEEKVDNLLSALNYIKSYHNNSLAYRSGCKSGICGSCAVLVNGTEKLSCKTVIVENDTVEPLRNSNIIKDLVVDISVQNKLLKKANAQLQSFQQDTILENDVQIIDKESNCILCNSCYSSCPVYEVNKEFIGPFALVRAYRYIDDKKEINKKNIIDHIQDNGVFSCTLCGNCNMVCPSLIDIKGDIMKLQNKSVQHGHQNPNMMSGFNDSLDFGFNPNGF
ncbi:MAG: succinate dehydrogenase [Epsilonproteobacteria bacterium]|nr:MAG: succinate dehydrogenase [Campylobacterota bacterium]